MGIKSIDVYVTRGLFGFMFRSGVYTMRKDFIKMGFDTTFTNWHAPSRKKVMKRIIARKKPFALVGHSLGGNFVTHLGYDLKRFGVKVPYMAVFDAPMPYSIRPNVEIVDNFYQFNDYRDPILKIEDESATKATQYDQVGKYNHIYIAEVDVNRNRVYEQVKALAERS